MALIPGTRLPLQHLHSALLCSFFTKWLVPPTAPGLSRFGLSRGYEMLWFCDNDGKPWDLDLIFSCHMWWLFCFLRPEPNRTPAHEDRTAVHPPRADICYLLLNWWVLLKRQEPSSRGTLTRARPSAEAVAEEALGHLLEHTLLLLFPLEPPPAPTLPSPMAAHFSSQASPAL